MVFKFKIIKSLVNHLFGKMDDAEINQVTVLFDFVIDIIVLETGEKRTLQK